MAARLAEVEAITLQDMAQAVPSDRNSVVSDWAGCLQTVTPSSMHYTSADSLAA